MLLAAIAFFILERLIIASQGRGSLLQRAVGRDWKGKLSPLLYLAGIVVSFWSPPLAQGIYYQAIQWHQVSQMHKSKLAGFIIDCQTMDLAGAASFWGGALGMELQQLPPGEADSYVQLVDPMDAIHVEVQQVAHPSRVHLDIETDDIDAEVRRLEALGATRVAQVSSWWVMEAPTGQRFCVVRSVSSNFATAARQWP